MSATRRGPGKPARAALNVQPPTLAPYDPPGGVQLFDALPSHIEDALRASIQRFGVLVPITTDEDGQILDGHHRQRIARELGVHCPQVMRPCASDEERFEIARSLNSDRRHLTEEQRRQVAHDLRRQGHSYRAIAGALGVSEPTARRDVASGASLDAPAQPEYVVGQDGKRYPARRPEPDVGQAVDGHELGCFKEQPTVTTSRPPITKPDLGNGVSHPARFSPEALAVFAEVLPAGSKVLDVFAGSGRVHELREHGLETVGVEIEEEWAGLHAGTIHGSALALPFGDGEFDAICTSPTYGNRLADHHRAKDGSLRRTYTHDLGHDLDRNNSGSLHWGQKYRDFHERAWREALRVLRPGGVLALNIQDHIRGGEQQLVSTWHVACLVGLGLIYDPVLSRWIDTPSLRVGRNSDARVDGELVLVFRRPS